MAALLFHPELLFLGRNAFGKSQMRRRLVYIPLLPDTQNILHRPIEDQSGREEEKHYRKDDWHQHHHLGLNRVGRRRVEFGLDQH